MKKYQVTFQRAFEVNVEADSLEVAELLAKQIIAQFPADTCKLLSIVAEDAVVQHSSPDIKPPTSPLGRPPTGGTPGTPVIRQEVLEDQIAEAA